MFNVRERWDVKDMFLNLISQILSIFLLVLRESVLFNEGFSRASFSSNMPHPQQKNLSGVRSIFTILRKGSFKETAAWLAQLAGRRSAGPEVAGSNFGRTNTQKKVLPL